MGSRAKHGEGASPDTVELVDADGRSIGACPKLEAHEPPGRLHRAFSVFLFDEVGRILLQRRAVSKYHFAGRWSNACCGHPAPGADVGESASRRLREELGVVAALEQVGLFTYWATDPISRLVEHEVDAILIGYVPPGAVIEPDPDEVDAVRFLTLTDLSLEMDRAAADFTPWLAGALEIVLGVSHPRR